MDAVIGSAAVTHAVNAGSVLLPLAYYAGRSCFRRIRDSKTVKKNVICLPSKSGKSTLAKSLVSNKNMLLIDLDEFIKTVNDKDLLEKIRKAKEDQDTGLYHILYGMAADKAYDFVKKETSKDKELRCIILTADYAWSRKKFKDDALYVAVPSHDLHKSILESAPKDERDQIEKDRMEFINRLPYESVKTYNSFGELESMIRSRFDIQHKI
jgi:adenylate kinase family enzyme